MYLLFRVTFVVLVLFVLGNWVYTFVQWPTFVKASISELCFVIAYTLVDKNNLRYNIRFILLSIILVLPLFHPVFSFIFYSYYVQLLSVSIFLFSMAINITAIRTLLARGVTLLSSSRISSSIASIIEISIFSYFLEIGIEGFLYTVLIRYVYIYLVTRLFFVRSKSIT